MSGTRTRDVPKGLDKLDASEEALFASMRADNDDAGPSFDAPAPAPRQPQPKARQPVAPEPPVQIEPPEPANDDGSEDIEFEIEVPEAQAEPAHDDSATRTKMVPHAQFHAAREQLKTARAKAEAAETARAAAELKLATEQAKINERVELLSRLAQMPAPAAPAPVASPPPAPAPIEIPDVNIDPVGHFRAIAEVQKQHSDQQENRVKDLTAIVNGLQERQQQAQQVAEMRAWGQAQELAFMRQEPDYVDAMAHLKQSRHDELEAIGVIDPAERERIINNDVTSIAARARQEGANFAERLFKASQKRGFAKKVVPEPVAPAPVAAAPGIPALDADIDEPPPAPVMDRATRVAQGRENATTIGSLGSAPPAKLSVAKIAEMSESQFAALVKRMEGNPSALRDLMGH